jgi:hypothetical protein
MLQMLLREYDLFGQVETWSREEIKESAKGWREENFDTGRGRLRDPQRLLLMTEEYLSDPEKTEKAWRKEGDRREPNMSGLYSLIKDDNIETLYKKRNDDPITIQSYRKKVNRFLRESDIEEFRKEAGLSD